MEMELSHCFACFFHQLSGLFLRDLALFLHVFIKVSFTAQLHKKVDILAVIEHRIELDDVTMAEETLDLGLFDQLLNNVILLDHELTDNFDGKKHARFLVFGNPDVTELASAQISA